MTATAHRLPAPTRIIQIREADKTTHDVERRTADLGILYSPAEQALLFRGLPVWREKPNGWEYHVDLEARAARVAPPRARPGFIRGRLGEALGFVWFAAAVLVVFLAGRG